MESATIVLGYWDIRGFAQHIRFLLEYVGANWTDKLYHQHGEDATPPFDKSDWLSVKRNLNLHFPNLPYLIDGSMKLTQSKAILRYIARKFSKVQLLGQNDSELAQIDMLLDHFYDINDNMVATQYHHGVDLEFINGDGDNDLPQSLNDLSTYLAAKTWFLGDSISVVDFVMYEYVARAIVYVEAAGLTNDYFTSNGVSNLIDFHQRFQELPAISKYLSSERFAAVSTFNNPNAKIRL